MGRIYEQIYILKQIVKAYVVKLADASISIAHLMWIQKVNHLIFRKPLQKLKARLEDGNVH